MRRIALLGTAIGLVSLTACSSNAETGALERFGEGRRLELELAIGDRLTNLIQDGQLPYVVSEEPNFDDATEEQTSGTGLPKGTWLAIGFEWPVKPDADHPDGIELQVYGPLELYAEAVRPYIDQMEFVVMYFLPWEDSSNYFLIYPEHMRLYLDGSISVKQFRQEDFDLRTLTAQRLVRLVEIAEILGVTKQRAHQIAEEKGFPAPVAEDARGRAWSRYEVQVWAKRWRSEKPWR